MLLLTGSNFSGESEQVWVELFTGAYQIAYGILGGILGPIHAWYILRSWPAIALATKQGSPHQEKRGSRAISESGYVEVIPGLRYERLQVFTPSYWYRSVYPCLAEFGIVNKGCCHPAKQRDKVYGSLDHWWSREKNIWQPLVACPENFFHHEALNMEKLNRGVERPKVVAVTHFHGKYLLI